MNTNLDVNKIYIITPRLKMSALHPYPRLFNISGATYPGDPHLVVSGSPLQVVDNPKSIITKEFKFSSLNIKFSGFKSLWTILFEWSTTRAVRMHLIIVAASFSVYYPLYLI